MACIELSIKNLDEKSKLLAEKISKEFTPDIVIYVARGSYLIGRTVSEYFKVPLIAVGAERKGNSVKEYLAPVLSMLPRFICDLLRKVELKSNVHAKSVEREIKFLDDVNSIDKSVVEKILIIDDSIDTGNSMRCVVELVRKEFASAELKIAVLNVMEQSKDVIQADYYCYRNAMLRTPMSKDSREYSVFVKMYLNRRGAMDEKS